MLPTASAHWVLICPQGSGLKSAIPLTQAIENHPCTSLLVKPMSWMQTDKTGSVKSYSSFPVCKPLFWTFIEWGYTESGGGLLLYFLLLPRYNGSIANAACGLLFGHYEYSVQRYVMQWIRGCSLAQHGTRMTANREWSHLPFQALLSKKDESSCGSGFATYVP